MHSLVVPGEEEEKSHSDSFGEVHGCRWLEGKECKEENSSLGELLDWRLADQIDGLLVRSLRSYLLFMLF